MTVISNLFHSDCDYLRPVLIFSFVVDYSGSSSDLTCHTTSETRTKKDVSVGRKGSFNLNNQRHEQNSSDRHWLDSLRRGDKKGSSNGDKSRLKHVAQYQPPPLPTSPFEQEGMKAAFEMRLDKSDQVQKANRLKSLFGSKQQKPCTLDLPKENQKTILGKEFLFEIYKHNFNLIIYIFTE